MSSVLSVKICGSSLLNHRLALMTRISRIEKTPCHPFHL
ncbi:Uncharacterized protein dnm_069040 [Desulfonema magnum]|uniref:Uncharacterized protein n=1 Tax=Desulfonema magnum TaxID=45655 RepID=A0A975BSU7_9BACT|nr:Uncharacterized protein dnm_069040 [Desulfonema magnum]